VGGGRRRAEALYSDACPHGFATMCAQGLAIPYPMW
jgi:hypothetical protein